MVLVSSQGFPRCFLFVMALLAVTLLFPAAGAADSAGYIPSREGAVGLSQMSSAEVGPRLHLRFGLHSQFFASSDFLIQGDKDTRLATGLVIGFTPIEHLEVFGGIDTTSNRNQRTSEAGRGDPEVIKSWGDMRLGAKVAGALSDAFTGGFEGALRVPPATSAFSIAPSAISLWLGPLLTFDLGRVSAAPLRFHVNVNYYVDNSESLSSFANTTVETRRVASFAYGVGKSRVRMAFGVDAPLDESASAVPLRPYAEYHAEVITAAADPALAGFSTGGGRDRHWVTFGLRARVYRGLTLDAGADVSVRHNDSQYGPPLPPYSVVIGVAYPIDIEAMRRPVVKEVPAPATDGEITGTVTGAKEGEPLSGAIVAVENRAHARVATDPDGTFRLRGIKPGPARVAVSAPAFEGETAATVVVAGKSARVEVALKEKVMTGSVSGKIVDPHGRGVQAVLHFSGTQSYDSHSASDGSFSASLVPGSYRMAAEAPDLGSKQVPVSIVAGREREIEVALRAPNRDVILEGYTVTLRTPIRFNVAAPKLSPKEEDELGGVTAILQDHPEIKTLRIEAHWDASAGDAAQSLTARQAQLVKDFLVSKGVAADRIEAIGVGSDQPLLPNITPANRARNRRIELHVVY